MRIVICGTRVPFAYGGAEMLVESLRDQLVARGHEVDVITLPFAWGTRTQILKSAMAWRMVDLTQAGGKRIDRVIATRFPSYVVQHPSKVVWLIHQMRQVYDLLGTPYSDFQENEPRDRKVIEMIRTLDRRTLSEARAIYTISGNVSERLKRYNDLPSEPLYPPPRLDGLYHPGEFRDYIFTAGRLDRMKRFDLLIRAMKHTETPVRCRIAGDGPERENLEALIERLGLREKVDLLGWVEDSRMAAEFAHSLGVYYAPYDEDYGYVTVEAFKSAKPVVTTADAGGVLEFVEDGRNGFVCTADSPKEIAARVDGLYRDRERAKLMGEAGRGRVGAIGWEGVVGRLVQTGGRG
jgi:glycosyltransferase involved in cell wall biosynthesis